MILHSITCCVYLLEAEVRRGGVGASQSVWPLGLQLTPIPTAAQAASLDLSL